MKSAVIGLLLAATQFVGPPAVAQTCEKPATAAALETGLLDWINQERATRGLAAYQRSAQLDRAAEFHACDMALRNYFDHAGPGEPKLGRRIKATGYRPGAANENIAYTQHAKVASVAPIWQNSPPHWAAILAPRMTHIGIAVTQGNGRIYWVMDVARGGGPVLIILP